MQIGKLSNELLREVIISGIDKKNEDIIVGPGVGEDCSVVKFGDEVCVLTTDPITAASNNAGIIGVHICCNDIASAGVRPLGILVTILAPPSAALEDIKRIMGEINEACRELSVDVIGGHTEVTDAVNRIVLSITAIGKGKRDGFVTTGGAQDGDDIVVTGYAGLEGTAIIAKDYYDSLKDRLDGELLLRAQNMLKSISVVKAGLLAADYGVHAMHDATEGGVLGAIWEMAEASRKGVYIYEEKLPVKDETIRICRELGLNPYRLISSGSMIIACSDGEDLCRVLGENGIDARVVGKFTDGKRIIATSQGEEEIVPPEADEIYRVKV